MKKILFVASECVPFIKTGGLADVCGALPKEFDKNYWDVRVVIPDYSCIPEQYRNNFEYVTHFYMSSGPYVQDKYVGVLKYEQDGVTYYFIDNQEFFTGFSPYTSDTKFEIEKYTFFDKAVLSMLPLIDFKPDIIHCHDWQTGFLPVYLKNEFAANPFFWGIKTIITIHNLKFQGIWDKEWVQGVSGLTDNLFTPDKLEFKKDANMLKGGLVYADYITTVSDTYANEIQTEYYGEGLNGLLSARHFDMQGIVNGIDYNAYDPQTDGKIYCNYNVKNGTCGIFMGPWWSLGYGNPDSFRNDNNANWQAYPLYTKDGEWNIHMKDVGTTYTMVNKNASDDVKKAIVIMNNVLVRDESTFDTSVAIGWYPLRNTMAATDECEYEYDALMGILKGESSADDYQQGGSKFNGLYKNLANDAATLSEVISSDYDGSRDLAVTDMDVNTNNGQFKIGRAHV